MAITWKYKIDVADLNVFQEIENERKISFPEELKGFILIANAATQSRYNFMVGNNEKVLGAVLSFNHGESDTDSVFTALSVIADSNLIPFGIDPFGNYICYDLKEKRVVFWNHETDKVDLTGKTLTDFIDSLY